LNCSFDLLDCFGHRKSIVKKTRPPRLFGAPGFGFAVSGLLLLIRIAFDSDGC
tara:strand:- start:102 stop:260 length:159 start_codon:yes stop_codon:yes gene_type:complete